MAVPFGFSVGDFLAAIELIVTVTDALRKSGISRAHFKSLVEELEGLKDVLIQVQQLDLEDRLRHRKLALEAASSRCLATIEAFWNKIKKYEPHMQATSLGVKTAWMRIKWAVSEKEDIEGFRARIRAHTAILTILLLEIQMQTAAIAARDRNVQHTGIASTVQTFAVQTYQKLDVVARSVAHTAQQGMKLLDASTQIFSITIKIYQTVQIIHTLMLSMPPQIQRQGPLTFTDPFNRIYPIHLEFIRSSEEFLAVMKAKFELAGCDPTILDQGDFIITENQSRKNIDLRARWDNCFFPGQHVFMSMVHRQQRGAILCPSCLMLHYHAADEEVSCSCGKVLCWAEEADTVPPTSIQDAVGQDSQELTATDQYLGQPSLDMADIDWDSFDWMHRYTSDLAKYRRLYIVEVQIDERGLHSGFDYICAVGGCWREFQKRKDLVKHYRQDHPSLPSATPLSKAKGHPFLRGEIWSSTSSC